MVVDTSPYPGETCTSDPARPWFRSCPDDPGQAPQPKALLLVGFLNIYLVFLQGLKKKKQYSKNVFHVLSQLIFTIIL